MSKIFNFDKGFLAQPNYIFDTYVKWPLIKRFRLKEIALYSQNLAQNSLAHGTEFYIISRDPYGSHYQISSLFDLCSYTEKTYLLWNNSYSVYDNV